MLISYFKALNISPLIEDKAELERAYDAAKKKMSNSEELFHLELAYIEFIAVFDGGNSLLDLITSSEDLKNILNYCNLDDGLSILNYLSQTQANATTFISQLKHGRDTMRREAFKMAFAYGVFGRTGASVAVVDSVSQFFSTATNMFSTFLSGENKSGMPRSKLAGMVTDIDKMKLLLSGLPEGKARAALMFLRDIPNYNSLISTDQYIHDLEQEQRKNRSAVEQLSVQFESTMRDPLQEINKRVGLASELPRELTACAYILNEAQTKLIKLVIHSKAKATSSGVDNTDVIPHDPEDAMSIERDINTIDHFFYSIEYAVCLEKLLNDCENSEESASLNKRLFDLGEVVEQLVGHLLDGMMERHSFDYTFCRTLFTHWVQNELPKEHQIQVYNALHQTVSPDLLNLMPKERAADALEHSIVAVGLAKFNTTGVDNPYTGNRFHKARVIAITETLDSIVNRIKSKLDDPLSTVKYSQQKIRMKINYLMKLKVMFLESVNGVPHDNDDQVFFGLCNLALYVSNIDIGQFQQTILLPVQTYFFSSSKFETDSLKRLKSVFAEHSIPTQNVLESKIDRRVLKAFKTGLSVYNIISLISALQSPTTPSLKAQTTKQKERLAVSSNSSSALNLLTFTEEDCVMDDSNKGCSPKTAEEIHEWAFVKDDLTAPAEAEHESELASKKDSSALVMER